MDVGPTNLKVIEANITRTAQEAQHLLNQLYAQGVPPADSALAQVGLRNGSEIVDGYVRHGELGLALEHLWYMISEPPLQISTESLAAIQKAAENLQLTRIVERICKAR